jgi:hypothetical protein
MAFEGLGRWLLWAWNLFLVCGSIWLLMGCNLGFDAGEYEWPLKLLRWPILPAIGTQVLATVCRR